MMVIFHFSFDLNYFGFIEIDFFKDKFWLSFQQLIVFTFLACVGMSLAVAHQKKIQWKKVVIRFAILAGWALVISGVTYFLFASYWIYFGILHCIALSSLIGVLFIRLPVVAGFVGIALLILDFFWGIRLPWIKLSRTTLDYIPLFPWFGALLFGIFLHHIHFHTLKIEMLAIFPFAYLGKHALFIYLLHQPVLFGGTGLIWWLKSNGFLFW